MHSTEPVAEVLDVRGALRQAMARLGEASVASHGLAAELLLMHVLGCERAWLYGHPEQSVAPALAERYFALVAQRVAGMPTQYLTGRQEFWGLEFEVTPDVLIPRPETEHVVEVALERLGPARVGAGLRIADLGTGSGCLAVALARELPGAFVIAADISPAALAVAQRNAARHGLAGRIQFIASNLLDAFLHQSLDKSRPSRLFDLIVSNPPYIGRRDAACLPREVGQHEPDAALFAGELGFELYPPLVRQAEKLLVPGGTLVLELSYNALARVRPLFGPKTWKEMDMTHDLAGIPRVIAAERI